MAQATLVMFHYHEYINAILEIISYNYKLSYEGIYMSPIVCSPFFIDDLHLLHLIPLILN